MGGDIIPVTVASSTTLPQSNSIHDQSYCTSTSVQPVPDITDIFSTPPPPIENENELLIEEFILNEPIPDDLAFILNQIANDEANNEVA